MHCQAPDRERRHHGRGVQAEADRGACGVSTYFKPSNAIIAAGLEAERRRRRAANVRFAGRKSGTRVRGISGVSPPGTLAVSSGMLALNEPPQFQP